jgi:hypothetical protein
MKKAHQKTIRKLVAQLQEMHADAESMLNVLEDEMDRRSEKYKEGEKGTIEQEEIAHLQDAVSFLDDAIGAFCNIDTEDAQ